MPSLSPISAFNLPRFSVGAISTLERPAGEITLITIVDIFFIFFG